MSESNGSVAGVTPRKPAYLFIALERAESEVDEARKELHRAERAEREARERVVGLLRRVGGPVCWDRRVFTPVYATAGGPVVDFRYTEFVHAADLAPEPGPGGDESPRIAAAGFAPVPEPDPEPADCEPRGYAVPAGRGA